MSLKKFATSAAAIAGLLATNIGPLATAAEAGPRWQNHGNHNYSRHYDGPRHYHGPRHRYAKRHRHGHGKDIATGLAIGLGVLAVGSIIANAHR